LLGRPEGAVDAVADVGMNQSPNDVFPTAVRLAILASFKDLEPVLLDLERLLRRKSLEFEKVVKAGRVHLQDSSPVSLGQEFNAFGSSIERSYRRMVEASHSLFEMNIGGLATGTGASGSIAFANRMVELLSHNSGLRLKPAEDHFRLSQSCSDFMEFSSSLRELAVELIKVANDLRLLGSGPKAGLYEITLPGADTHEDAAVPVITESINMIAYQIIGNDTAVMLAAQAGQLELNAMTPLVVSNILESIDLLRSGLLVFSQKCVAAITANVERCASLMEASGSLYSFLEPIIGAEQTRSVIDEATKSGRSVREVILEQQLVSKDVLDKALHYRNLTHPS
jgi:aspartate ammonia-lyase